MATRTHFDQPAFAAAVAAVIRARGLSDRAAAREAGVSPSTITRTIRGSHLPDVDGLAALANWATLPIDAFVIRTHPIATPSVGDTRRIVAAARAAEAASLALGLLLDNQPGRPE